MQTDETVMKLMYISISLELVSPDYHSLSAAARAFNTSESNIRNICECRPIKRTEKDGSIRYFTPKKLKNHTFKYQE